MPKFASPLPKTPENPMIGDEFLLDIIILPNTIKVLAYLGNSDVLALPEFARAPLLASTKCF